MRADSRIRREMIVSLSTDRDHTDPSERTRHADDRAGSCRCRVGFVGVPGVSSRYDLGPDRIERYGSTAASSCCSRPKCLLPFAIVAAWQRCRYRRCCIATAAFVGTRRPVVSGHARFCRTQSRCAAGHARTIGAPMSATLRREIARPDERLAAHAGDARHREIDADIESALLPVVARATAMRRCWARARPSCTKLAGAQRSSPAPASVNCAASGPKVLSPRSLRSGLDDETIERLAQAGGLDLAGIGDPHVAVVARLTGLRRRTRTHRRQRRLCRAAGIRRRLRILYGVAAAGPDAPDRSQRQIHPASTTPMARALDDSDHDAARALPRHRSVVATCRAPSRPPRCIATTRAGARQSASCR